MSTVKIDFDINSKSINELEDELKAVNEQLNKLPVGSKEFTELNNRAKTLSSSLEGVKDRSQQIADKFMMTSKAIKGGFDVAIGGAALFGEKSQESMEKLANYAIIGATALDGIDDLFSTLGKSKWVEGVVTGFQQATTASKVFYTTGIGLVLAGLASVVVYWDDISKAIGINTDKLKINKETIESSTSKFAEQKTQVSLLVSEYENSNTSLNRKKEIIGELNKISPNYFSTELKNINDLKTAQDKFNTALYTQITIESAKQELVKIQSKYVSDIVQNQRALSQDFIDYLATINNTTRKEVLSWSEEVREASRSIYDERQTKAKETLKVAQQNLNDESKAYIDYISTQTTTLNKLGGDAIVAANTVSNITDELFKKKLDKINDLYKKSQAEEILNSKESYDNELKLVNDKIALYEKYGKDTADLELERANIEKSIREQSSNQTIADLEEVKTTVVKVAESTPNIIETIFATPDNVETPETVDQRLNRITAQAKKKLDDFNKDFQPINNGIQSLGSSIESLYSTQIEGLNSLSQKSLSELDKRYEKELSKAGDNATKRKQIEEKYAKDKLKIESEYSEKQKEIQKKAANVKLAMDIAQIITNTSKAVSEALAAAPPPFNLLLAGISGAAGGVQLANAIKQRENINKLERGGLLFGKLHSQGGIPIGNTGVEVEGGESVINRNSTRLFTPLLSKINELGGGRPLTNTPSLNTSNTDLIDYDKLSLSLNKVFQVNPPKAFVVATDITTSNDKQAQLKRKATLF